MMFDKIRQDNPKAWNKFYYWLLNDAGIDSTMILCDPETVSGWLYKFFDEQGIYIEIFSAPNPRCFFTQINRHPPMVIPKYNTRQEAEQAAFTKAFEILEERANGK